MHKTDFQSVYQKLELKKNTKPNKTMWDALQAILKDLKKANQPLGIHHKLQTVPKNYRIKYQLQSLYHFEMPSDFRLMYTVRKGHYGGKEALLLQLLDHDEYNKIFQYFKKRSH